MATKTHAPSSAGLKAGQRLHCTKCGSEIEIIQPCTCRPSTQVLRCCGEDMRTSVGQDVHVSGE